MFFTDSAYTIWIMIGVLILFALGFFLYKPFKVILKTLLRGAAFLLLIFVFNIIFSQYPMGINIVNLFICGVLGAPGFALIYGFTYLL